MIRSLKEAPLLPTEHPLRKVAQIYLKRFTAIGFVALIGILGILLTSARIGFEMSLIILFVITLPIVVIYTKEIQIRKTERERYSKFLSAQKEINKRNSKVHIAYTKREQPKKTKEGKSATFQPQFKRSQPVFKLKGKAPRRTHILRKLGRKK